MPSDIVALSVLAVGLVSLVCVGFDLWARACGRCGRRAWSPIADPCRCPGRDR